MWQLGELVLNALMTAFLGVIPERPLWLRRLVQALWLFLAVVALIAWAYGVVILVRALA
jgi:hypothetical protein